MPIPILAINPATASNPSARFGSLLDYKSQIETGVVGIQNGMTAQVVTGNGNPNNLLLDDAKSSFLLGLFHNFYQNAIQMFRAFLDLLKVNQSLTPAGK